MPVSTAWALHASSKSTARPKLFASSRPANRRMACDSTSRASRPPPGQRVLRRNVSAHQDKRSLAQRVLVVIARSGASAARVASAIKPNILPPPARRFNRDTRRALSSFQRAHLAGPRDALEPTEGDAFAGSRRGAKIFTERSRGRDADAARGFNGLLAHSSGYAAYNEPGRYHASWGGIAKRSEKPPASPSQRPLCPPDHLVHPVHSCRPETGFVNPWTRARAEFHSEVKTLTWTFCF